MTMTEIEVLAQRHADALAALDGVVADAEAAKRKALAPWLKSLETWTRNVQATEAQLTAAIERNRGLFKKPRSRILHGIKVGLRKKTGAISWADADSVVALIRRHFPRRFADLVKVEQKPLKGPLARLTGDELKKLGVTITNDSDEVFITVPKSDTRELADALLEDAAPPEPKGKKKGGRK